MKQVFGLSIVEGAPLGNKNAAGPHMSRKGNPVQRVRIGKPYDETGRSVASITRRNWKTKSYKMTPSSKNRLIKSMKKAVRRFTAQKDDRGEYVTTE
jgi:hypothetical protein